MTTTRDELIAAGVLKPRDPSELTRLGRRSKIPVLRMDDRGLAAAARIARDCPKRPGGSEAQEEMERLLAERDALLWRHR